MAARIPSALRSVALARPAHITARRGFQTSQRMMDVAPVRKPVGAFRGT
jgi:hypothetical protein